MPRRKGHAVLGGCVQAGSEMMGLVIDRLTWAVHRDRTGQAGAGDRETREDPGQ